MLDNDRKSEILGNLREIYQRGQILAAIDRYNVTLVEFLTGIQRQRELVPEDQKAIQVGTGLVEGDKLAEKPKSTERVSEIYALVGGVTTIIAFVISIYSEPKLMNLSSNIFKDNEQLLKFALGVSTGLLASLVTGFILILKREIGRKSKSQSEPVEPEKKRRSG